MQTKFVTVADGDPAARFRVRNPSLPTYQVWEFEVYSAYGLTGKKYRVPLIEPISSDPQISSDPFSYIFNLVRYSSLAFASGRHYSRFGYQTLIRDESGLINLQPGFSKKIHQGMTGLPTAFKSMFRQETIELRPLQNLGEIEVVASLRKICPVKIGYRAAIGVEWGYDVLAFLPRKFFMYPLAKASRPSCFEEDDKIFELPASFLSQAQINKSQQESHKQDDATKLEMEKRDKVRIKKFQIEKEAASRQEKFRATGQQDRTFASVFQHHICPYKAALLWTLGVSKVEMDRCGGERCVRFHMAKGIKDINSHTGAMHEGLRSIILFSESCPKLELRTDGVPGAKAAYDAIDDFDKVIDRFVEETIRELVRSQ